jgi:hypothetical protein
MENIAWGLIVVWLFLLVAGQVWQKVIFSGGGAIIGFILAVEVIGDSFLFAVALALINTYVLWITLVSEV